MRFVSWNLWNSFKRIENPFLVSFLEPVRRREKRYFHQLKLLSEAKFDLCLLQEVNPVYDKLRDFKDILGYQSSYQMDQGGVRFKRVGLPLNFNNALVILSKDKQKKVKGLKLSGSFGANEEDYSWQFSEFRYALFSEVYRENHKILVVNTHFHHGIEWSDELDKDLLLNCSVDDYEKIKVSIGLSTARKAQEVQILLQNILDLQSLYSHVIVAGDFNFSEGADLLRGFSDLGLARVEHHGFSWDPDMNHENHIFTNNLRPPVGEGISLTALNVLRLYDNRKRTMDHVFVSPNVKIKSAQIFGQTKNQDDYYPSDHFGIEVEVDL
jgi:endonuclease/exonuclease/phosphatase family metal-dependent hydrolase